MDQVFALCRPGFENDCANELMHYATRLNTPAYIKAKPNTGYTQLILTGENDALAFMNALNFEKLIFTRQWLASSSNITVLPEQDRIPAIKESVQHLGHDFNSIELSYADTNTGKSLSKFCACPPLHPAAPH